MVADADDADEALIPSPQIRTDGANEEGVTSTIPMVRDPVFCEGRRRWCTTRLDRTRKLNLPRFRALQKGKTPTHACLVVLFGEIAVYRRVAAQIGYGVSI